MLGYVVKALSTFTTFLRSFWWGQVRQLNGVSRDLLAGAWDAGTGPGSRSLVIDIDSTVCETCGISQHGVRLGGEIDGGTVRLVVRRVNSTPRSQLALITSYSYRACITERKGDTLALEADHRRHAEIENATRDLGVRRGPQPSSFGALPS